MSAEPPRRVGPYRLEGRLGRGGMGEVYRAFDERLDRWVALKLIRPETAGDDRARQRFRREARAAAALNHPAIVQIHDIVETPEGDAIVMELVAGETLARLLRDGPLDLERALRIGREVALGLAAAHARGIVHRDLKPENVMVTEAGHAKILDFGLAWRAPAEGEAALSIDGTILGTYRSMSPEQARGRAVDARSDLFSLGTLLYETVTGVSPFEGGSVLETLTHICTVCERPAAALRPEVPAAVSDLIGRLLEKEPGHRPQSAAEVAAELGELSGSFAQPSTPAPPGRSGLAASLSGDAPTLVDGPQGLPASTGRPTSVLPALSALSAMPGRRLASAGWRGGLALVLVAGLVLGLVGWGRYRRGAGKRLYVAVVKPEIGRGADLAGVDLLAAGLRVALLRGLLGVEGVSTLAPEQVDAAAASSPQALARALAADELVTARLDCHPETCQVTLSRILGKDGTLLGTGSYEAPVHQPFLLAEAAQGQLEQVYKDRSIRPDDLKQQVLPADYVRYLRLRTDFDTGHKLSVDAALASLREIRRGSPRFVEAASFEAALLRARFEDKRDPADLEAARQLLAAARAGAPTDPRPLIALFEIALKSEQLDRAEAALADLDRLRPGDASVSILRARLLERRGAKAAALDLMRSAVRARPSLSYLFQLAYMEYRFGEKAAARAHLEDLLKRSPGYRQAQSVLAQLELLAGNPERAAAIYRQLTEGDPRLARLAEVENLGIAYLLLRRYPEAEEMFRRALDREPGNPLFHLNLADVRLLQGDAAGAAPHYGQVLALAGADPAAANWQLETARAQAFAHLGRKREAVEALQPVLVSAGENAQALTEVSLVYVLVGDAASALVNADRALARGVEPVWFDLPWFAPLRQSPEFQELLKRRPPSP